MEDKSKSLKRRREDDSIPSSPEACNDPHESALAVVVAQVDENVWSNIASYFWLDDLLKLRTVCHTLRRAVHLTLSQATALHLSLFQIHKKCRGMIPNNNGNPHHSFDAGVAQLFAKTTTRCLLHFDVSGIRHLTGRLPGMYSYDNNYNHNNPTTWLVDLFQQAPCLESIILTWCARFEGTCFQEALQEGRQIPNLRHLGLIGCTRIENRTLHAILRSPWFQSLRTLHIGGCSQTIGMEPVVTELLFRMPNLQSLDISGLDRIQGPDLWALVANLPHLEILGASECRGIQLPPNPVLEELITQQLQHPNLLQGEEDIVDQMDRATRVYQETNQRQDFQLQVLRLDEIGSSRTNSHPGSLAYVAMTSRRLVEVSLSGCQGLVDYDVLLLVKFCHATLRSICLRDIPNISDRALEAMGARCSQLIELDVSACVKLTDRGIVALVSGCPPLRVLRMAHLPEVTDKSLRSIATHLNRLIVLDIHECSFPTNPSTIAFSSNHLVELDARDCNLDSTRFHRIPSLSIRDGRRIPRRRRTTTTCCTNCQVWNHAQRLKPQQGVPLRPMWHCRDCSLVPSRDRAMCDYCASHCHKGHAVFCSGFTRFYCDCAFGYGGSDCQSFPTD